MISWYVLVAVMQTLGYIMYALCAIMFSSLTFESDCLVLLNPKFNLGAYVRYRLDEANGTLRKTKKRVLFRDYRLISQSELELSFPCSVVRKTGFKK